MYIYIKYRVPCFCWLNLFLGRLIVVVVNSSSLLIFQTKYIIFFFWVCVLLTPIFSPDNSLGFAPDFDGYLFDIFLNYVNLDLCWLRPAFLLV